jgi:hypothetical protein
MYGSEPTLKVRTLDEMFKKYVKTKLLKIKLTVNFKELVNHSTQMFIFQLVETCHQYNKHKTDIIKISNVLFVSFLLFIQELEEVYMFTCLKEVFMLENEYAGA